MANDLSLDVLESSAGLKVLNEGFDSGKKIGFISGPAGVGKSTLADHYAQSQRMKYTGGIHYLNESNASAIVEAAKKMHASSLFIINDAERMNSSILSAAQEAVQRYAKINLLVTARDTERISAMQRAVDSFSLSIGGISADRFARFAEIVKIPDYLHDAIKKATALNPEILNIAAELVDRREYNWDKIGSRLRDFQYPELMGEGPASSGIEEPKALITDIQEINKEFLRLAKADPSHMRRMNPRDFEKLVEALLKNLGYETELTPSTRDGGLDIYAARKDRVGKFLYLVECKRYNEDNIVGVDVVRSLYGVVQHKRANGGIVVTTSGFSKDAKDFSKELMHQIQLKDYLALQDWIDAFLAG